MERFLQLVEQLPLGAPAKQQVCTWQAATAAGANADAVAEGRSRAADDAAPPAASEAQPPPLLWQLKEQVAGGYMATWKQLKQVQLFAAWLPKTLPGKGL
jgi:hypothetical protein